MGLKVKKVSVDKSKPVQVKVGKDGDEYFVTIWHDGTMEIRPKGARDPERTVATSIRACYAHRLLVRAKKDKPKRSRRTDGRGLLALEREAQRKGLS